MADLYEMSAQEISRGLDKKDFSARELTEVYLRRITSLNPKLNAYISVFQEEAMVWAGESDARRGKGEALSPWDGIPIAIKDNIALKDQLLSCGSGILANFQVPYNSYVSERIFENGLIPLGKTNMDEFAMGSSNETSFYGNCLNPWDTSRVPGGSSGGSAACVAASMAPWSLGSDTGGSIRLPASFCGTAGLKPTYGRVSRYGLVAYGSSLDQIGPIAKNAADAAILLDIISGRDLRDSTSVDSEKMDLKKIFSSGDRQDLKGWKIGLPQEYFSEKIHPEVRAVNEYCAAKFKEHGAELVPVNLSYTDYAVPVYYLIATAEASSNLARYDGVRYGVRSREAANIAEVYAKSRHHGFGKEVKRRILLGTYVLSAGYYDAYYRKASKVRTLIRDEFLKVFQEVDLLLAPVSPSTAFRVGEKMTDPIEMYLSDILTISANLAGIPAMSVNGGFSREGLPVGVQLLGSYFQEEKILSAALFLERFIEKRKPDLLAEHDSE